MPRNNEAVEILNRNEQSIRRMALRKNCARSDIDDIVQEVSINLINHSRKTGANALTNGEVGRITQRRIADYFDKMSRSPLWHASEADGSIAAKPPTQDRLTPYRKGTIDLILGPLRPRVREIITRRFLDDQEVDQIAAAMGMTTDGVKSSIRRSRRRLRCCSPQEITRK